VRRAERLHLRLGPRGLQLLEQQHLEAVVLLLRADLLDVLGLQEVGLLLEAAEEHGVEALVLLKA